MFHKPKIIPPPATLGYLESLSLSRCLCFHHSCPPSLIKNLWVVVEENLYFLGFSKAENSNILQNGTSETAFSKQQRERALKNAASTAKRQECGAAGERSPRVGGRSVRDDDPNFVLPRYYHAYRVFFTVQWKLNYRAGVLKRRKKLPILETIFTPLSKRVTILAFFKTGEISPNSEIIIIFKKSKMKLF
jgi:hypothetical protein